MFNTFVHAYSYWLSHWSEFAGALRQHLLLVGAALGIAAVLCIPLGLWTSRSRTVSVVFINLFNTLRVIPSLAILFIAIPYLGLTLTSAILALTVLASPPILVNTDIAFRAIDPSIREAAFGMGMTPWQVLRKVEAPLALPVILAGLRTSLTEVIASGILAAFIGVGGLGIYVIRGFALYDNAILLVGAVPVALLALSAELIMTVLQRAVTPPA